MFSAATYAQRRTRLKQEVGSGLIVLPANNLVPFNYTANQYDFRQDSTFLYFAGLDLPGMVLVIDADTGAEILFGHDPTIDDVIWEGPLPSLPDLAASSGIAQTRPAETIGDFLKAAVGRPVHYLPPYHADIRAQLGAWLGHSLEQVDAQASLPLIRAVIAQRSYKSAEEVAEMEKALAITREIYLYALRHVQAGKYEYEIVGGIRGIAASHHGAMAYTPIFSVNGHVLHNHHYGNRMQAGQWIVADLGAENHHHYASDLTRTIPVSPRFSAAQADIYNIVLRAHVEAAAAIRPGTPYRDCHMLAWRIIAEGLTQLGILQGDAAEMAEIGVPGLFMPHGLGHMLGLDVHDMENLGENYVGYAEGQQRSTLMGLKSLRLARPLEDGFVLTVEPGIYFIPPLIDRWEAEGKFKDHIRYDRLQAFRNMGGCRIEDNYLVTADGHRMLGQPVPRTLGEVEAARGA